MKKILSAVVAAGLALGVSISAFALDGGGIVKPRAGSEVALTIRSGDTKVAGIHFYADNDPDQFYFNVNTDMDDCKFKDLFADQEAYYYEFVVDGRIPSTSLPTVRIFSPYREEVDGGLADRWYRLKIYEVDGDTLTDVSGDFAAMADDDGNYFFDIRTRTPGTYILAEKAVQETVSAAVNADSPQLKSSGNQAASEQQSTQRLQDALILGRPPFFLCFCPTFFALFRLTNRGTPVKIESDFQFHSQSTPKQVHLIFTSQEVEGCLKSGATKPVSGNGFYAC